VNQIEKQVLENINTQEMIEYLQELISIQSVTGEEKPAQINIAQKLESIGMTVDYWSLDLEELSKHPDYSIEVDRTEGHGVVGSIGGQEGKSLILNGHVDVVSPGNESNWTYPPWQGTIKDGRIFGRGSVDMKGGLACAIYAVIAIMDSGVKLKGKVLIQSVISEEDGGIGTLATILRGYKGDGAIIMEPTELKIAPSQAGALCFRITVKGLSAHACVREEGVSALEKFILIHERLIGLEKERNSRVNNQLYSGFKLPIPLNMGKVQTGNWPSTVPETLVAEGRYGVMIDEDVDSAKKEFIDALNSVVQSDPWLKRNPPQLEWWGGQFNPASIPVGDPIVKTMASAYRDTTGNSPVFEGVTYGSDMRHLVNVGDTPTILFGPGNVRDSHKPDESVKIEDLMITVKTLALVILRFCGY
jgi:acetylornithine deacetylase